MFGDNQYGLPPENTEGFYNYRVREEYKSRAHVVSTCHLDKIVQQLTGIIDKYLVLDLETGMDWSVTVGSSPTRPATTAGTAPSFSWPTPTGGGPSMS